MELYFWKGVTVVPVNKGKLLLELFRAFLKISPVTFGGGYAMIPVIEREVVERRKWLSAKDMPDMLALAGSAPGAIGVNTAIVVGYRIAGIPGAVTALIGMMMPTFVIVVLLAILLFNVSDNPWIKAAFQGVAPAVVALIIFAGYRIGKTAIVDKTTLAIACATVVLLLFAPISPVWLILCGAAASSAWVHLRSVIARVRAKRRDNGPKASGAQDKSYADTM